jgi:predicted transcriptional regulator
MSSVMALTKPYPNLPHLKKRLQAAGITQQRVADRAGVVKPHVCSVLAGRYKSRKVVDAAKALLSEARKNGR